MKTNAKFIRIAALALTLSVLAACSKNDKGDTAGGDQATNIVGGRRAPAAFEQANGIVALVINTDDGQGLCSGTLIDRKLVLTAAHCLDGSQAQIKSIAVVFAPDLSKATKEAVRFGVKGLPHKDFLSSAMSGGKGSWNDIALILLDSEAPADFKTVNIATAATKIQPKAMLVQAGYGKTKAARDASGDSSGVLKSVSGIQLGALSEDGKELLMVEDGKGSCNGDSGGPAFLKNSDGSLTQVGIDSRGTETDTCLGTGIYTNVQAHLDWIKENSALLLKAQAVPAPTEGSGPPPGQAAL